MAETLKIRYQGNVISIPNNSEFNPESYGLSKINIRINSQSTMRLGLTTNTEALSYCKMKIRFNNQDAYIGRVSSITYTSGDTADYKGSTSVSRSTELGTSMYTNNAGSGSFTSGGTISKGKTATNSTGSTVTTNTGYSSGTYTNGAGSGSFTSGGAVAKGTKTNNTGSTVTTNTGQSTASGTSNYGTGTRTEKSTKYMNSRSWMTTVTNNTGSTVSKCSWQRYPSSNYTTIFYTWSSSKKYTNTTYKASWTSCKKNSATTYKGSWTSCKKYTQSTTSITETCHNFNI